MVCEFPLAWVVLVSVGFIIGLRDSLVKCVIELINDIALPSAR